jgi:hypothetical protein
MLYPIFLFACDLVHASSDHVSAQNTVHFVLRKYDRSRRLELRDSLRLLASQIETEIDSPE